MVLAASAGSQFAFEKEGLGVFTRFLLEGLGGEADADGDDAIRISELRDFAVRRVEGATEGLQRPVARREVQLNDFVIVPSR